MKICMIISTPFPPKEGIGYYTYNLSKKLIEKGHKVIVITRGSFKRTQRQKFDGIEIIKAPFIPIYPFYLYIHGFFVNKILKSLEKQIDIIHIHTPLPPVIRTNLPIVTTVHTPMLTSYRYVKIKSLFSLFSKISARLVSYPSELKLIQSSYVVTTVSESIAQELRKYYTNQEKIIVVGNGVDEEFYKNKQKNTKEGNKNVLYAGRIEREKGLFDLIKCGKNICGKRSDISFIIAGNGRDLNKLKRMVKKEGISNRFSFLGQVEKNQLKKLYQKATLFILPSYHEGLSTVLLEAMSCGLPVIATNVRGNLDLVSNRKNGIIIPPRSPDKMTESISILIENKELREKLGKNARKTIENNYTWNKVSKRILECYKSLVKLKAG